MLTFPPCCPVLCCAARRFNEFKRFAPSIQVIVYHGNRPTRHGIWTTQVQKGEFHVLLTTYDFIINKKDTPKLGSIPWEYIVVDEGHRMKNTESKLTTTLSTRYTSKHRLILTGTPLQNSLKELWALLNFLLPTIFNSADNFEDWYAHSYQHSPQPREVTGKATTLTFHLCSAVLCRATPCYAVLCVGSTSRSRTRAWIALTWMRRRSC